MPEQWYSCVENLVGGQDGAFCNEGGLCQHNVERVIAQTSFPE